MIYTDNSEVLKNALAKIAELEDKLTVLSERYVNTHDELSIAIEALESIALGALCMLLSEYYFRNYRRHYDKIM